jgi:hypothetical protein
MHRCDIELVEVIVSRQFHPKISVLAVHVILIDKMTKTITKEHAFY